MALMIRVQVLIAVRSKVFCSQNYHKNTTRATSGLENRCAVLQSEITYSMPGWNTRINSITMWQLWPSWQVFSFLPIDQDCCLVSWTLLRNIDTRRSILTLWNLGRQLMCSTTFASGYYSATTTSGKLLFFHYYSGYYSC
jgi:hypothetical protein